MKKSYLLLSSLCLMLFVFTSSCVAQKDTVLVDNWYEVNAYGKAVAFSKVAKEGRISVFIVSTTWCKPCIELKNNLFSSLDQYPDVDFYYILMNGSTKHNYKDLKETAAYDVWMKTELLKEWPTVYVLAPTTNVVKKFNPTTIREEGYTKGMFQRTVDIIEKLRINTTNYSDDLLITEIEKEPYVISKATSNSETEKNATATADNYITHTIEQGDNLTKISKKYNVTADEIKEWNNLNSVDDIKIGETLIINKT